MKYFKHLAGMRNDPRIRKLIHRYGLKGYGLYCIILESIADRIEPESPMPDLEENSEDIAAFYNEDTTAINEMTAWMVNSGLLEVNEITARITCMKIYKFLETSQTRSEYIRNIIKGFKSGEYTHSLPDYTVSKTVTDKYEEEREEVEENNKNTVDKNGVDYKESFDTLWFNRISGKDRDTYKKQAKEKYYNLITKHNYTVEQINLAYEAYSYSCKIQQTETQYIKQLQNFLKRDNLDSWLEYSTTLQQEIKEREEKQAAIDNENKADESARRFRYPGIEIELNKEQFHHAQQLAFIGKSLEDIKQELGV